MIDSRFLFQRNFEILNHKLCLYFNLLLFNCQWSAADRSALGRVLRDLIIIPHLFRFVKGFFKSFLSFFQELFQPFLTTRQPGGEVPEYYITFSRVCQEVFQKFFQLFFVILFRGCLPLSLLATARWQLAYYSTFIPICQAVFDKFFQFGCVVSLS